MICYRKLITYVNGDRSTGEANTALEFPRIHTGKSTVPISFEETFSMNKFRPFQDFEFVIERKKRHSGAKVFPNGDDGNTVEKKKAEADQTPRRSGKYLPLSADADDQKATEASSTDDNGDTNEDVEFEGLESPQSLIMSERNASRPLDETKLPSSSETREIVVGSIVLVQSRTWPGINKHGGELFRPTFLIEIDLWQLLT